MAIKTKASFIEPMLLLRSETLPEGPNWQIELKLDGYRALAIRTGGKVQLRSRNNNDFSGRYPMVVRALSQLPDETVIDGEIVALDESGRPSFNTLQKYGSATAPVFFYAFDLLILAGRDLMREPLRARRQLLDQKVLLKLKEPIRQSPVLEELGSSGRICPRAKFGRVDRKTAGQRLRTRPALRRMAQNAGEPGTGVRYWRVYTHRKELRCAHLRVLRRRPASIRCPNAEWLHSSTPRGVVPDD